MHPLSYHSQSFLYGLLEVTSYSHYLTHTLHAGAQLAVNPAELAQIPTGNLADYIIEGRLEECTRSLGDRVLQFEKTIAQAELGCHKGQWITGGLAGQCRRPAEPGIHLNDTIILALRVEGILHITLTDNANMANNLDGERTQLMIFTVGERLRGSDDYRLSGMDAKRIEVLHVAHRNAVVIAVAHYLVLDFLPSLQALLHQDLGRERESLLSQTVEFILIVSEATAQTT